MLLLRPFISLQRFYLVHISRRCLIYDFCIHPKSEQKHRRYEMLRYRNNLCKSIKFKLKRTSSFSFWDDTLEHCADDRVFISRTNNWTTLDDYIAPNYAVSIEWAFWYYKLAGVCPFVFRILGPIKWYALTFDIC